MSKRAQHVRVYGYSLLNIRLWWHSLAFVHLVVTAVVTLSIDVTLDEDPLVRAYDHVRWKLVTCWFNMISLAYLPLCLYCDWCEKRDNEPPYVEHLRILRDIIMTSILMPVTTVSDVTFWMLFKSHSNVIAPPRVFEYVPLWAQHSLHTISLVTVIGDLILTPRRRPDSMKFRLAVLMGFTSAYCLMLYVSLINGVPVYAFLSTVNNTFLVSLYFSTHIILTACYFAQWQIIDYIWGQKGVNLSRKIK